MKDEYKRIMACVECIQKKVNFHPKVALVLGSGLGDYGDNIDIRYRVDYAEIDNFPISTVEGHQGRFLFGYIKDVPVVVMQGRIHYYEGYSMSDVVLPIRLMHLMGAEILMLTNSSGGLNPDFVPGDLMMITDQISTFVPSPLIGKNIDELGTRFPDMTHIYDRSLQQMIRDVAKDMDFSLKEGVYIQFTGPNYESPAEVRMARLLGSVPARSKRRRTRLGNPDSDGYRVRGGLHGDSWKEGAACAPRDDLDTRDCRRHRRDLGDCDWLPKRRWNQLPCAERRICAACADQRAVPHRCPQHAVARRDRHCRVGLLRKKRRAPDHCGRAARSLGAGKARAREGQIG